MTSSENDIRKAITDAINDSTELREWVMSVPEKIEQTVEHFTPVLTGETVKSIATRHRKTPYRRLSTRRIKIGQVYSDDDPVRVAAIEYGRHDGDKGTTEGAHMFAKAVSWWMGKDNGPFDI